MKSIRPFDPSKAPSFIRSMIGAITLGLLLCGSRQNAAGQTERDRAAEASLRSLDPRKTIAQYTLDIWQDEQGLPQSVVQAIVQTPEGYLWLGLEEGLVRFDGVQFTHFHKGNTAAFTYNDVPVLLVDRAGNLWIGTDGGGLLCFKEGKFTVYTTKQGLTGEVIEAIYEDRQGSLWVGTNHGLSQWRDGKFTTHTSLSQHVVLSLCEDRGGNLWIGTDGGGLHCYKDGRLKTYTTKDGLVNDAVWTIFEDKIGRLWIGTNDGLNYLYQGKFTRYTTQEGLAGDFVRALAEDRAGSVWIGTRGGGINRWRDGRFTAFSTKQGLSNDFVDALYEDHEGSLWIGTYGGGLNRLRDGKFTNYSSSDGLSSNMVWTVYEDKAGNLWFGTDQGLNRFKDGKFTHFTAPQNNGPTVITALREDRAGNFWIGTAREGLYRVRQNNWTLFTTQNGLASNTVRSVLEDRQGRLWIGSDRGLNLFQNGTFQLYTTKDGLSSDQIRYLYEDKAGALWIGTRAGGLNRLQDGQFTIYTTNDGLASDLIRPIYEDQEGALWIGTNGGGLSRFQDGKFFSYTIKNGLFDDSIFQILEDDRGNFWMSCNKGIFRVNKQELNDFAEGKIKSITAVAFGKADGMKTNECNGGSQPAGWKTRDGKMWFPTIAGVAMIDPANIKTNPLLPPVVVERVIVDREPIDLLQKPQLAPGSRNLEFHYTGLSFLAPQKVKFKYQLEGYDNDWIDAGTRRTAFYTNIAPGDYTFRVQACNNDGKWNESGAQMKFSLSPYFYQTGWFFFLGFLALVLTSAGAYRYHVRQIRQREEDAALRRANQTLESRVKERTAELEQSQNFLNSIIEHLPLMLFIKDAKELRYVRFNRAGEDMIGLTQQEMLGKNDHDFFPPEQADFFTSKDRAVLSSGNTTDIAEEPIQTPRGTRWLFTRKTPVFGADGQPKYLLGLSEDITERKQTETALRESEARYRSVVETATDAIITIDEESRISFVNPAAESIFGYTVAEMLGQSLTMLMPPKLRAVDQASLQRYLATSKKHIPWKDVKLVGRHKSGKEIPVEISFGEFTKAGKRTFTGIIRDVTARQQAEQAVQQSEEQFRQLAENIKSVFRLSAAEGNQLIYVSPAYEEIWGRSGASLYESPQNWLAAVHSEDLQRVYEAVVIKQASGHYDEIYRIQRPDGSVRWIRDRAFPVRDQNGAVYRIAGISEDITALKQAEHEIRRLKAGLEKRVLERTAELRGANTALQREAAERQRAQEQVQDSEGRFRQLAENINQVLWVESLDQSKLLYVSPVYEKIWGRERASLYEQPHIFLEFVHQQDRELFQAHLSQQRKGEFSEMEYRIQRPDGEIRWIRDRSFPIRDASGKAYRSAGISEDVTDRKQMEEQVRRHSEELEELVKKRAARIQELERQRAESDKLAAAGRMAARIAHEINNPLAGIQSSFQLLKGALSTTHRYYHYAGIIESEIERIANIIRQMYDLYRPEKESVRPFRIDQTIRDVVALLKAGSHDRGVSIESEANGAAETITLSEGLLRQVLYNLIQNALEASPSGSVVKVSAATAPNHLNIAVADQGHGIPAELRSLIFEPFFTTKIGENRNSGLGLGLSVTKSIVDAMGGTIAFESQADTGTVFRIELPI